MRCDMDYIYLLKTCTHKCPYEYTARNLFYVLREKEIYSILRHAAKPLFYFPKNVVLFMFLPFSVQIILMFSYAHC
jgi:hypothetical protein